MPYEDRQIIVKLMGPAPENTQALAPISERTTSLIGLIARIIIWARSNDFLWQPAHSSLSNEPATFG